MYRRVRMPFVWRDMDHMQREMNRMFEAYSPARVRTAPGYPAMNVWTNEQGVKVTAEVPGVNPDDIDINVVGETLTLTGTRQADELKEDARYHRQERGYGKFTRSIQLPFAVDVNQVEAVFSKGVLNITLPRAEADKPRKIAVKSLN